MLRLAMPMLMVSRWKACEPMSADVGSGSQLEYFGGSILRSSGVRKTTNPKSSQRSVTVHSVGPDGQVVPRMEAPLTSE